MTELTQDEVIPSVNVSDVLIKRDRLYRALDGYVGQRISQDELVAMAATVSRVIPGIPKSLLVESMRTLAGTVFDDYLAFSVAWRLAGNVKRLKQRQAVHPWAGQYQDEWVPAAVLSAEFLSRNDKPGYTYTFRLIAGTPAGLTLQHYWNSKFTYILARHIGFTRYGKVVRFNHPLELVGMRMSLLLTPESCGREMRFARVGCARNFMTHNRDLAKKRARIGFTCPFAFDHPCHRCPVGITDCSVAVRLETQINPLVEEATNDTEN